MLRNTKQHLIFPALIFSILLTACGGGGSSSSSNVVVFDNKDVCDSHLLPKFWPSKSNEFEAISSDEHCIGTKSIDVIVKTIPIYLSTNHTSLTISDQATVFYTDGVNFARIVYTIRNDSEEGFCWVSTRGMEILNSDGVDLIQEPSSRIDYIAGEIYSRFNSALNDTFYSGSCIESGDIAYISGIEEVSSINDISSIKLESINSTKIDNKYVKENGVLAIEANWVAYNNSGDFRTQFENIGTKDIFPGFVEIIYFDENGMPTESDFLNHASLIVKPGERFTLNSYLGSSEFKATKALINIDWKPASSEGTSSTTKRNIPSSKEHLLQKEYELEKQTEFERQLNNRKAIETFLK